VIPIPDEKWGEVPKALVVLKPNAAVTESELIEEASGCFGYFAYVFWTSPVAWARFTLD